MIAGIKLNIYCGKDGYDISNLVISVVWKGRKGAAARSIAVTILDDNGYQHARSGINILKGYYCILKYLGEELFRGIILSQQQGQHKTMQFTAYDQGIYLANNKDTFSYYNKTASDIFKDCCTRFQIPFSDVAETDHKIKELVNQNKTAFDIICEALSLDFDHTGIRHYIFSERGKLKLLVRKENIKQWVIETGSNVITYNYGRSLENIKTRIKLVSKEGKEVEEAIDKELEKRIGIFQDIQKPKEKSTKGQLKKLVENMLAEKSQMERDFSVEAVGIPDVIAGYGVYVMIKELSLSRTFYVDEDVHTFVGNAHTMNLKLTRMSDAGKDTEKDKKSKKLAVGQTVQFLGGYDYLSNWTTKPRGEKKSSGLAKIDHVAKGELHPYHIVSAEKRTTVFGWVDEDQIKAVQ